MFKDDGLSLIYFTSDPIKGQKIIASGADALFVDCENKGKTDRQNGFDTEINYNKPEQVKDVRLQNPHAHIMCRVNNDFEKTTEAQIETAISCGANTIVLPLTESVEHIIRAKAVIKHRAQLIVMIESQIGVDNFHDISKESFAAVYIGLNDLSISRGGRPLFQPLWDGTVEKIIALSRVPVGVGGITEPSFGHPIKSQDIIERYAELGVKFTVLRRSFENAIQSVKPEVAISNIKGAYIKSRLALTMLPKEEVGIF